MRLFSRSATHTWSSSWRYRLKCALFFQVTVTVFKSVTVAKYCTEAATKWPQQNTSHVVFRQVSDAVGYGECALRWKTMSWNWHSSNACHVYARAMLTQTNNNQKSLPSTFCWSILKITESVKIKYGITDSLWGQINYHVLVSALGPSATIL